MDGKVVYEITNWVYDYTGTHLIDQLKFQNFHGGKSDAFRPDKTQYVWFDDIAIQEGECAPARPPTFTDVCSDSEPVSAPLSNPPASPLPTAALPSTALPPPPPSPSPSQAPSQAGSQAPSQAPASQTCAKTFGKCAGCLLYTSDAADE